MEDLDYRNLVNCRVEIASSTSGASQPPVRLPQDCWNAANMTLPPVYVFALEKSVLRKKEEAERELESGGSREELERNLLIKMKSVTKASEDVCVSLLENNSYDLKTSIEAYFASSNS